MRRLVHRPITWNAFLPNLSQPVTLQLFRDLFTIFYEPLIRVYKSANVYSSVTDFAAFADDMFLVVEKAQRQDVSADPNQTVQSFIDLCARHEHNFYKFVHEVHIHDNGLFTQLMNWLEGILEFLRRGPRGGKLDMNALFQGAVDMSQIDKTKAIDEINALIKWQEERKKWHQDKTRQKMAADGVSGGQTETAPGTAAFRSSDFGLDEVSHGPSRPPLSNPELTPCPLSPTFKTSNTRTPTPTTNLPPTKTWIPSTPSASAAPRSRTIYAGLPASPSSRLLARY